MNIKKQINLVGKSGYFDEKWYRNTYKDISAIKDISPLEHFLKYGWLMERDPSPKFSTQKYNEKYDGVKKSGINPLVDFLTGGKYEKRVAFKSTIGKVNNDLLETCNKYDACNLGEVEEINKKNEALQKENDLLLTELHRTQEELERIYLEKNCK